ncbi:MAG: molybdopterin-dependent oxidoreductase [Anaerovoracaceae bacterium]|jgi:DMSO/TMAO reductase YedYZ molybdopterin-dependent catalytic subunit
MSTKTRKLKLGGKTIVIGFVILVLVVAVTAWINHSGHRGGDDGYTLSVQRMANGKTKTVKKYTLNEIRRMKSVNEYAKLLSAQHADEKGVFTGVPVADIVRDADPALVKKTRTYIFSAGDGYSSAASAKEIAGGNDVIVAYAKDGRALEHFNDGGAGPMRVVFTEDTYGNRGTKFLVKIICRE